MVACAINSSVAQSITLRGKVINEQTTEGIPYANLLNLDALDGTTTDTDGFFEVDVEMLPISLRISSLGYQADTVLIKSEDSTLIFLRPISTDLPMVEIRAQLKMQRISDEGLLPYDFEVWEDYVFALSRRHTGGQNWIEVIATDGTPIARHELDIEHIRKLDFNCRNRLYLINRYYGINLGYAAARVVPLEKMSIIDYNNAYRDCVCSNDQAMYYQMVGTKGLLKRYLRASLKDGQLQPFKEIFYEEAFNNYQRELGLIEYGNNVDNTGEVSRKENTRIRNAQHRSAFLQNFIYSNPKDNYLFITQQRIVLFNHDEQLIEFYQLDGEFDHSIPASYANTLRWKKVIFQDRKTEAFYTLIGDSDGYELAEINLLTGTLGATQKLHVQFYDKIIIYNRTAFVLGILSGLGPNGKKELFLRPLR
jgi:hypothetical protein